MNFKIIKAYLLGLSNGFKSNRYLKKTYLNKKTTMIQLIVEMVRVMVVVCL